MPNSKHVLCLLLLGFLSSLAVAQQQIAVDRSNAVKYTKDSLQTVKDLVQKKKAIVVDVRSKAEWDQSHLKIAKFIPTDVIRHPEKCANAVKSFKKDQVVYVHCKRGARAKICAGVLTQMGYDARPLKVNYEDLGKAGFEEVVAQQAEAAKKTSSDLR